MTVGQSIINWLQTFDATKLKTVDTDILAGTTLSYAILKEPTTNIKSYISGKKEHTDYYQIMARLSSQTNTNRISNNAWLESLSDWIEAKDKAKNYPTLDSGTVQKITITSSFYVGYTEEKTSVYQLTIGIKYVKEN